MLIEGLAGWLHIPRDLARCGGLRRL